MTDAETTDLEKTVSQLHFALTEAISGFHFALTELNKFEPRILAECGYLADLTRWCESLTNLTLETANAARRL